MSSECIVAIERSSCTNYFFRENKPQAVACVSFASLEEMFKRISFFLLRPGCWRLPRGNSYRV